MAETFLEKADKIWLYQFKEILAQAQLAELQMELDEFTCSWQSHGQPLHAKNKICYNHLLIIAVNQSVFEASGCSIDKLTHLLMDLNQKYGVNFFNRLDIGLKSEDNSLSFFSKKTLLEMLHNKEIAMESLFLDISLTQLLDQQNIFKPLTEGWFYKPLKHA